MNWCLRLLGRPEALPHYEPGNFLTRIVACTHCLYVYTNAALPYIYCTACAKLRAKELIQSAIPRACSLFLCPLPVPRKQEFLDEIKNFLLENTNLWEWRLRVLMNALWIKGRSSLELFRFLTSSSGRNPGIQGSWLQGNPALPTAPELGSPGLPDSQASWLSGPQIPAVIPGWEAVRWTRIVHVNLAAVKSPLGQGFHWVTLRLCFRSRNFQNFHFFGNWRENWFNSNSEMNSNFPEIQNPEILPVLFRSKYMQGRDLKVKSLTRYKLQTLWGQLSWPSAIWQRALAAALSCAGLSGCSQNTQRQESFPNFALSSTFFQNYEIRQQEIKNFCRCPCPKWASY